jgi:hypothetical protein
VTEAEWLACADPAAMLAHLRGRADDRRLRLFAVACCRRVQHIYDAAARNAIDVAERMADGLATNAERRAAAVAANRLGSYGPGIAVAVDALTSARGAECAADEYARALIAPAAPDPNGATVLSYGPEFQRQRERERERRANVPLLRDIFGNPFRPVVFAPEWRTDTAVAMARQMYELRDFSGMPILADALQDAGCENDDVLQHCRGSGLHARGCWVVDAVLGKA